MIPLADAQAVLIPLWAFSNITGCLIGICATNAWHAWRHSKPTNSTKENHQ